MKDAIKILQYVMKFKVLLLFFCSGWFIANAQDRILVELNNTQII